MISNFMKRSQRITDWEWDGEAWGYLFDTYHYGPSEAISVNVTDIFLNVLSKLSILSYDKFYDSVYEIRLTKR